jgi:hypothetical protein
MMWNGLTLEQNIKIQWRALVDTALNHPVARLLLFSMEFSSILCVKNISDTLRYVKLISLKCHQVRQFNIH